MGVFVYMQFDQKWSQKLLTLYFIIFTFFPQRQPGRLWMGEWYASENYCLTYLRPEWSEVLLCSQLSSPWIFAESTGTSLAPRKCVVKANWCLDTDWVFSLCHAEAGWSVWVYAYYCIVNSTSYKAYLHNLPFFSIEKWYKTYIWQCRFNLQHQLSLVVYKTDG